MSVQHYKNGQLSIIAGAGGIGGGGGECDCENKTFTGTTAEVEQAIADGVIKDDYIVNITDDVTAGAADVDILDSYDEIMTNTEEGKAAGALGVKEVFEKIDILNSYEEIMANTENDKIAGTLGVKEGFEDLNNSVNTINENLNILGETCPTATTAGCAITNAGSNIPYNVKVTKYLCFTTLEMTPSKIEHNALLAWGLWPSFHNFFLTLPMINGQNVPCMFTANGELRMYYPQSGLTPARIDFAFMYPLKQS